MRPVPLEIAATRLGFVQDAKREVLLRGRMGLGGRVPGRANASQNLAAIVRELIVAPVELKAR